MRRHMMPRQKGVISRISARGELGRRIRDMGLVQGIPVVLALNMVDVAAGRGIVIDAAELYRKFDLPVLQVFLRVLDGKGCRRESRPLRGRR